jgi:PqqD family protein of HPr-rel-A system
MTYRYAVVEGIRAFDFDHESIVFNPLSWDAHLLNAAATAVLDLLASGPQSAAAVEEFLGDLLVDSEKGEAAAHSQRLLNELSHLGLIQVFGSDGSPHR